MSGEGPARVGFSSGGSRSLIDFAARSVHVDGDEIALTPTEFDVLACLAQRAGRVVPTSEIIESVWGDWYGPSDHVFVHIHHIRRKLGPCGTLIVTKRKVGYLLRGDADPHEHTSPWSQIRREYSDLLQEDARSRGSIWILADRDRKVTWISDSITTHLGWAPSDLIGKHPWVVAPQEEIEILERSFPEHGGSPLVSLETRVRHADGRLVDIYVHGQVIMAADGHRLGGIGEWRLIPPGRASSADEPRRTLAVPFLLHYDAHHVLTGVEPHQPFLGWDPEEVIGTHFSLGGLERDATDRVITSLSLLGNDHALGTTTVLRADGSPASVDIGIRLQVQDGQLQGYTGDVRVID